MKKTINLIMRCVAVAMAVAVITLRILHKLDTDTAVILLGIGMICLSLLQLEGKK